MGDERSGRLIAGLPDRDRRRYSPFAAFRMRFRMRRVLLD
jgi:hypothetical protein